jgi:hypothetical protein
MLIPNNAYYEFYGGQTAVESSPVVISEPTTFDISPLSCEHAISAPGATWLVTCILQDLGVLDILNNVFDKTRTMQIVLTAAYMLSRGNVMEYTADWCDCHVLNGFISSQSTSHLFANISFTER